MYVCSAHHDIVTKNHELFDVIDSLEAFLDDRLLGYSQSFETVIECDINEAKFF